MILTIHRGASEIGGSCVELEADGGRIVLDLGMPLVAPGHDKTKPFEFNEYADISGPELVHMGVLPCVPGVYEWNEEEKLIDGLIISHAHQDHYGLLRYLHPSIPVYASKGTAALLDVSALFLPNVVSPVGVRFLEPWKKTRIGCFSLTPYLVDHSAPDALALEIETHGRKVFYSGDLRSHGRKSVTFERLVAKPPEGIDCLLLEGTTIGRPEYGQTDETSVENALVDIFEKKTNVALVFSASQNIDRIVSVYRAALRTGSVLVMDLYTGFVLASLRCISNNLPQIGWDNIRVFFFNHHLDILMNSGHKDFVYQSRNVRIRVEELAEKRDKIVVLTRANRLFPAILGYLPNLKGLEMIWSMWRGYLTGEDPVSRYCKKHGLKLTHVHTSGHADLDSLKRFATALNPKSLIPIHTFHPELYAGEFPSVIKAEDGQRIVIGADSDSTRG